MFGWEEEGSFCVKGSAFSVVVCPFTLVHTYIPLALHNKTELVELVPINLQFDTLVC